MIDTIKYMSKPLLKTNLDDYAKMSQYLFDRNRLFANHMRKKGLRGQITKSFLQD